MGRDTDMRPEKVHIRFNGREYEMAFNISAIDTICERFECGANDIVALFNDTKSKDFIKNVVAVAGILINEAISIHNEDCPDDKWDEITERQIKRSLTHVELSELYDKIVKCYINSFARKRTKDDDDIGEDPNAESGAT